MQTSHSVRPTYIKVLLSDNPENVDHEEEFKQIIEKIEGYIKGIDSGVVNKIEHSKKDDSTKTFYIFFKPNKHIFDNGTNPLFLVDELANLGKSVVLPYLHEIPVIDKINPHLCYTSWEIILSTSENVNSINDVFIFVEGNCVLDIHNLSDGDLLENKKFVKKLEKVIDEGHEIGIDQLKELVTESGHSVVNKLRKVLGGDLKYAVKDYSISSIRVSSEKLDNLMNMVSELVTTQARLTLYAEKDDSNELTAISENIQKLSRQLRDLAFEIVLVPIETLVTRFQRLIRDLSKELNKEVRFETKGTETELDKTIIN
ncbi:MAG: hypothetical protein HC906_17430 [Bacteroidales bacterium]|nr:hypothetical protein [Bacteroidales bacterium]